MRDRFITTDSEKPSREPWRLFSEEGSLTPRVAKPWYPSRMALGHPSTSTAEKPDMHMISSSA